MKFEAGATWGRRGGFFGLYGKSFSLHYNDIARYLFITLAFAGLLSTGWFGIPLVPRYLLTNQVDILAGVFTLFSALGTVWGVMAYREFTRAAAAVLDARYLAKELDPMIGDYEYRSYNPATREYERGFVPLGPVDFWAKETQAPSWMDKGKYWHVLLGLQSEGREISLQVVKDSDLPYLTYPKNVAVTIKETIIPKGIGMKSVKRYRYTVKIPQWLVMNTERKRYAGRMSEVELTAAIGELNNKIVSASDVVIERERPRIKYPWRITTLGIYLNKSLPLRIVYRQVIRHVPGQGRRTIEEINANLVGAKIDDLVAAITELASQKGIPPDRIEKLQVLAKFLNNAYTKQGLGEGASEYHSFHHSLEVSYMSLHMLPEEFQGYIFTPSDYEVMLVAGFLHDYDPAQPVRGDTSQPRGPAVFRTMKEIQDTRILEAYFTMNATELQDYFREYKSTLSPSVEYATTHPEYVKTEWSPTESVIAEALIWRTDFPFFKQKLAQEKFAHLLAELTFRGQDSGQVELLGRILWLADLAVTYMGSDPVRAWDRVTNLYDELYLSRLEAVSRTDAFFADFAEGPPGETFNEIITRKDFPEIFRRRWNVIYKFFHEGNPTTQINKTILNARKLFFRVNMELGLRKGEMLYDIASNNWSDFFIGIGKDQNEVQKAKSLFAGLDPQNAAAFWGDAQKLLPGIVNKSVDNFLMVVPQHHADIEEVHLLLSPLAKKLAPGGLVQILTDIEKDGELFSGLMAAADSAGFRQDEGWVYFTPKGWKDPDFSRKVKPQVIVLRPKH